MKDILVIGGEGTLGSFFGSFSPRIVALGKKEADITSLRLIKKTVEKYKPRYIINCAALTDIAYCEKYSKRCLAINRDGVKNLKSIAQQFGIKLVQISTDAAIRPKSMYGRSKKEALMFLNTKDLIITTTFYTKETYVLKNLLAKKSVEAYSNMYFNPVSILFLATTVLESLDKTGNLHVFSKKKVSKYMFAKTVARVFDRPVHLVHKTYFDPKKDPLRKVNSFLKPDISIDVQKDMLSYKNFLHL